jgi:hypothetical protein
LDAPGKVRYVVKSVRKRAPVKTCVSPSMTPEHDINNQKDRGKGSKSSAAIRQGLLTTTTIKKHGSQGPASKTYIAVRLGSLLLWGGLSVIVSFLGNWPGSRLPCSNDITWHSALTPPEAFCRVQWHSNLGSGTPGLGVAMLAPPVGGEVHNPLGFVHPGGGASRDSETMRARKGEAAAGVPVQKV